MTLILRLVLGAAGGLLAFASFEPLGWWICGILAISCLYLALAPWQPSSRSGAFARLASRPSIAQGMLIAFVHGLTQYLLLLPWVGEFVGALPFVGLAVACSIYALLTGSGGVAIARWNRWGFLAFPLFYLAVEYVRSNWPFGGFAWVRLAWGQIDGPLANLAALGGPALVTTAAALAGTALVTAFVGRRGLVGVATVVVILAAGAVTGLYVDRDGTSNESVRVAAIQGNVPRMGLDFNAQRRAVLANHVRQTQALDEQVDLVIWPENSSDVNPFTDEAAARMIESAVQSAGAPVMVGTITVDEVGPRNTMQVFDPHTGPGEYHHKKFLQPFGEYMPYRDFFRLFSPYVDQAGNFQPGDGNGVVHMTAAGTGRAVVVGIATCYEVAFDAAGRDAIASGAEFLTTPTNNATFGFTDMTYQQLAMSRMRAIELDRAVVVAATSGVSAMVAPDGSVMQQSGIFESATLVSDIPLKETVTVAARIGFQVEMVLVIIGAFCGIVALWATARTPSGVKKPKPRGVDKRKKRTASSRARR